MRLPAFRADNCPDQSKTMRPRWQQRGLLRSGLCGTVTADLTITGYFVRQFSAAGPQ
jgi:hypothetical protein